MKNEFYETFLKFNVDFKSNCCIIILYNLYSLMDSIYFEITRVFIYMRQTQGKISHTNILLDNLFSL